MDLSILIPVYNWDLTSLLAALCREIDDSSLGSRLEIIVVDDASSDAALRERNTHFLSQNARPYLQYGSLERNAGRAAVRNLLAAKALGTFLLFLDCDVLPDAGDFVRKYLEYAGKGSFDVVCGGISYRTRTMHGAQYDYHAYLGQTKEVKGAAQRNQAPWRFILTSNIMVRKSVFLGTSFDERFTGYGYEDIEWGVRLAQHYRILHIDNTASHLGLVSKSKAYDKMRNSVSNYLLLREIYPPAYHSSAISRLVPLFMSCSGRTLSCIDGMLGRLFLWKWLGNRIAFIVFQLNFAVLLAQALQRKPAANHE